MKSVIICITLIVLFIAVICIYGARGIVGKKVVIEKQNKVVLGMKIFSFFIAVISLSLICYLK